MRCATVLLALCISPTRADELPTGEQCPTDSCQAVATEVPVIDIRALINSDQHSSAEWDTAAEAVANACEEWGFFQASSRGL